MTFYAAGPGLGGYDAYGAPFLRGDASTAFTIAFNYWYAGAGTRDARQHYEYIETDGTLRFTILRYRYVRYTE